MTSIILYGKIKQRDDCDERIRFVEVERAYKNQQGQIETDEIPCMLWSKDSKNHFLSIKEGFSILCKGRVELLQERCVVIVEEFQIPQ